jgi:fucose 4-O-acetylase-like acetyltransferase
MRRSSRVWLGPSTTIHSGEKMENAMARPMRNNMIDIAKGIGIILVVIGHNNVLLSHFDYLKSFIYSFHMPLFFILSGIYLKSDSKLFDFIFNRCNGILKPYIFGAFLIGFIFYSYDIAIFSSYALGVMYGTDWSLGKYAYPLWFLPTLFFSSVLCWIVMKINSKICLGKLSLFVFAILLLIFGIFFIQTFHSSALAIQPIHRSRFNLDLVPITSAYILFGITFKEKILNMRWAWYKFLCALLCLIALLHFYPGTLDLAQRKYGIGLITSLKTFFGIYLSISISSLISNLNFPTKFFSYIGRISLTILLFHAAIQGTIISALIGFDTNWQISGLIPFILTIVFCAIIHEVIIRINFLEILLTQKKIFGIKRHARDTAIRS